MSAEKEKALVPKGVINEQALEDLRKESADLTTWARVNRGEQGFTIGGAEGEFTPSLIGVVVGMRPCWASFDEEKEEFSRIYDNAPPENDLKWGRRCDLDIITAEHGPLTLDLSPSGYKFGLGGYLKILDLYKLSFEDVITEVYVVQAKSRKFGKFNTVKFKISQAKRPEPGIPELTEPIADKDKIPF